MLAVFFLQMVERNVSSASRLCQKICQKRLSLRASPKALIPHTL